MVKDKSDSPQPQTPDPQRRQLLRGLSTVPVIATLTPVSASAASLLCTDPTKLSGTTPPPDATAVTVGTNTYQCLPASPVPVQAAPPVTADIYDPINGSTATGVQIRTTNEPATSGLGTVSITEGEPPTSTTYHCAVYVDGSGAYTYDSGGGTNAAIGASCMLSIANA